MGPQNMRRPWDKHLNEDALNALVPSSLGGNSCLSAGDISEAEHHLLKCDDCSRKVSLYGQVVNPPSDSSIASVTGPGCPKDEDVDWHEVAVGLWPELKANQLVMHAAQCGHCGPLLRAALCVDDDPTPAEEKFLAQLRKPSRPVSIPPRVLRSRRGWQIQLARWAMPIAALAVIVGMFRSRAAYPPHSLSGPEFAALAVNTYRQQAQGMLALDVHAESPQQLNEWFKSKSQFAFVLPSGTMPLGGDLPFRILGARLLAIAGQQKAAYIAYDMKTGPVGLMVTPESVALASGGTETNFKKVSFHYSMVRGYRVVTWSIHGLTYGLVSREGNQTQQSCMVCHSAMRDRDLSHTPTPLYDQKLIQPLLQ